VVEYERGGELTCGQGEKGGAVRVYLVQHGEAKSEEEDPDRPLTDRGATEVRRVAGVAAGAGSVMVERIVHSGKTRARQTAAVWGEALGVPIDETDGLAPRDDPAIWRRGSPPRPGT
jgi:phosphohistidine phosphatase